MSTPEDFLKKNGFGSGDGETNFEMLFQY